MNHTHRMEYIGRYLAAVHDAPALKSYSHSTKEVTNILEWL